ncbi:uncharacterized protein K452DRAFT_319754 [Aplosporella prunicola CBS 121167]|uniref:Amino acid permease/ SLC12A domain-containing protein n=1 Tax=Aplosporella prunicola CBS 121167 TaxID=1176127 RepID=A0A6A6BCL6_9PEZI|nr:uncharacterized protein K452DRAFT_319754 [Aplosporella prunicola CBS 121167]KAF2140221.1 hypothetical protein K452DRAFT_319754 [Aplosporella prunicola CBS 121167]
MAWKLFPDLQALSQQMSNGTSNRRPAPTSLRRDLGPWQIFMIVISATVGVGFFVSSGEILAFAGPGTVLVAFACVGIVAFMVMEGVSEMVMVWPVPNPMVQFVRHFVDRDLAIVVCVAYWYTYAISMSAVIATSGVLIEYWSSENVSRALVYLLFPVIILLINLNSVKVFGFVELVGGYIKLIIVAILFFSMIVYNLGGGPKPAIHSKCIKDGFQSNDAVASTRGTAAVLAISIAVYPYIGIEGITMTAFEARDTKALKRPARLITIIVTITYLLSVLGFVLNVNWTNPYLPRYYNQWDPWKNPEFNCTGTVTTPHLTRSTNEANRNHERPGLGSSSVSSNHTLPIIAIEQTGQKHYADFINGCLLYSALSTANTALFIASRTLYGLGQSAQQDSPSALVRFVARFGRVDREGVPQWAVWGSFVFAWVPLLSFGSESGAQRVQQVLTYIGSTSCVLVWAPQSWAYIRYHKWLDNHRDRLKGPRYGVYDPLLRAQYSGLLRSWQPAIAWFSMLACIIIVLGFAGAGMAKKKEILLKALDIYLGPGLCFVLFLVLKFLRWRSRIDGSGWVKLGDWEELKEELDHLTSLVYPELNVEGDQRRTAVNTEGGVRDGLELQAAQHHSYDTSDTETDAPNGHAQIPNHHPTVRSELQPGEALAKDGSV